MSGSDNSWLDQYNGTHANQRAMENENFAELTEAPYVTETYEDSAVSIEEDYYDDAQENDEPQELQQRRRPSRVLTIGCATVVLAFGGSIANAAHEKYDPKKSKVENTGIIAVEGIADVFLAIPKLIDNVVGNNPKKKDTITASAPLEQSDATDSTPEPSNTATPSKKPTPSASPSPTASATPSPTPSASPSPTASPTKALLRTPESCVNEMPNKYKTSQNIATTITSDGVYITNGESSVPETLEKLRQYDIGNVVVVGKITDENKNTIKKFTDGKTFSDPVEVIYDPNGSNINHITGTGAKPAVSEIEPSGAALVDYYQDLRESGVTKTFVRIVDEVVPSTNPNTNAATAQASNDSFKRVREHLAAAKIADIDPIVVHTSGIESMSLASKKTNKLFGAALLRSTAHPTGAQPLVTDLTKSNVGEAFNPDIYSQLKKEFGIDLIFTDDLGKAVDKDGKPMPLTESMKETMNLGAIPIFASDANNAQQPLTLDTRFKSITNSLDKGVNQKQSNKLMIERLKAQDRLNEACRIADRENAELTTDQ